jgi:FeS assembly SUF system protein
MSEPIDGIDDSAAVDALKVHRIEPEKPRKHLHVMGSPASLSAVDETPPSELAGLNAETPDTDPETIRAALVAAMKTVYDPEIPVDIYQLGLIYDIAIDPERNVVVRMTLTAPGCPVAGSLVGEVARKAAEVPGVTHAKVDLVFDPPWTMEKMSDEAKLELGLL